MSGRRLVLPAGLAAGFDPLHGLSEPPECRRDVTAAPTAPKTAENASTSGGEARFGGHESTSSQPPVGRPSRPSRRCGFHPSRSP